jgi:hypothetical protein
MARAIGKDCNAAAPQARAGIVNTFSWSRSFDFLAAKANPRNTTGITAVCAVPESQIR